MHLIETVFTVTLVVLLAVLGWAVFAYLHPYRQCRWCMDPRRRKRRCWRCKGTRLTRRLGASQVHKVKLSLHQAWTERSS